MVKLEFKLVKPLKKITLHPVLMCFVSIGLHFYIFGLLLMSFETESAQIVES